MSCVWKAHECRETLRGFRVTPVVLRRHRVGCCHCTPQCLGICALAITRRAGQRSASMILLWLSVSMPKNVTLGVEKSLIVAEAVSYSCHAGRPLEKSGATSSDGTSLGLSASLVPRSPVRTLTSQHAPTRKPPTQQLGRWAHCSHRIKPLKFSNFLLHLLLLAACV